MMKAGGVYLSPTSYLTVAMNYSCIPEVCYVFFGVGEFEYIVNHTTAL